MGLTRGEWLRSHDLKDGVLGRVELGEEVFGVGVDLVVPDDAPDPEGNDGQDQVKRIATLLSLVDGERDSDLLG